MSADDIRLIISVAEKEAGQKKRRFVSSRKTG
jgi:hypothetical protein